MDMYHVLLVYGILLSTLLFNHLASASKGSSRRVLITSSRGNKDQYNNHGGVMGTNEISINAASNSGSGYSPNDGCCCRCQSNNSNNSNDSADAIPEEQKLMQYLLYGYETAIRPVKNSSHPVRTKMGITLTQIFDMDEKNQVLVTNVWLDQEWYDEHLTWDPEEFSGLKIIRLPPDKIWRPDLVLYNNAADFADNLMPALAMIYHTGRVFWPVPTKLRSSCKVDVTYFPFDEQVCNLKFGSWTYDGFQLDLSLLKDIVDLKTYVPNGEWELTKEMALRNNIVYPCCIEPYPDVTFYLFLRRRILYYMYHVIYPCIMMSTLTLLVFCLPPDSGEKIALGITVLLAFSVLMLSIAEKLPETSESVPIISIYLTVVMSMTSVSVIMTVFVLNLHHRGPCRKPVPTWLRRLIFKNDRNINSLSDDLMPSNDFIRNISLKRTIESLCSDLHEDDSMQHGNETSVHSERKSRQHLYSNHHATRRGVHSCLLDDSIIHETTSIQDHSSFFNASPIFNNNHQQSSHVQQRNLNDDEEEEEAAKSRQYSKTNRQILDALKKIIEKHDSDDLEAQVIFDWRKVAQFVDKVLFWVYMICTITSTFVILVIAPIFRIIPYNQLIPKEIDHLNASNVFNATSINNATVNANI